jgi:hypothetical protein
LSAPRKLTAILAANIAGYRMRPACAAVRSDSGKPHRPGLKRDRDSLLEFGGLGGNESDEPPENEARQNGEGTAPPRHCPKCADQ